MTTRIKMILKQNPFKTRKVWGFKPTSRVVKDKRRKLLDKVVKREE
jgi:hypothetical protein